jgi:uncharacterized protein (DUF2249 family)
MKARIVTLDVREDLRQGRHPFEKILQTVAALRPNQLLRLLAPFEPVPLFAVLAQQGFTHQSRQIDGADWEVLFSRTPPHPTPPPTSPPRPCQQTSSK